MKRREFLAGLLASTSVVKINAILPPIEVDEHIIYVGENQKYKTIQSAIDSLINTTIDLSKVEIRIVSGYTMSDKLTMNEKWVKAIPHAT